MLIFLTLARSMLLLLLLLYVRDEPAKEWLEACLEEIRAQGSTPIGTDARDPEDQGDPLQIVYR